MAIVNYASSGINKLKGSLNDDARVIIYDRRMFIVQATGDISNKHFSNKNKGAVSREITDKTSQCKLRPLKQFRVLKISSQS